MTWLALLLLSLAPGRAEAATGIYESYVQVSGVTYVLSAGVGANFQGQDLGSYGVGQTLTLNGGELKVFKSGGGDVSAADLFYTVYQQGARPGSPVYTRLSLPYVRDLFVPTPPVGSINQSWNRYTFSPNLLSSLAAGTYVLEVYGQATTNEGDRFINNNGNPTNYTATFTVAPRPTATLANAGPVCVGTGTNLTGNLTGTGPWSLTYTTNGSNPATTTVPAGQTSFSIPTGNLTASTAYAITALSDLYGAATTLPNPINVTINSAPTIAISGGGSGNCAGSPTPITFTFTGTGPWTFSYFDGTTTTANVVVNTSPYTITPTITSTTTYTVSSLSDANCTATALPAGYAVLVSNVSQWTGATSTDWFDPTNWIPQCVPNQYIDAEIPVVASNRYPVYTSVSAPPSAVAAVRNLSFGDAPAKLIYTSGTLELWGDITLGLNRDAVRLADANYSFFGTFFNAVSATSGSKLRILGNVPHAIQSLNDVWDMEVDTNPTNVATTNSTTLRNSLVVWQSLTMSSGVLNAGAGNSVILGNPTALRTSPFSFTLNTGTARLSEVEGGYVLGDVVGQRLLSAGASDDCLGLGLTLTPAAGSPNPGSTRVDRTTGTAPTNVNGGPGILRYFQLQPATGTGLDVRMEFAYFNHELNGLAPAELRLFRSTGSPGGPWVNQDPITAAPNVVTKASLTNLGGLWTLGKAPIALPVSLSAFEAQRQGADALLSWRTASETNNAGFEVQLSLDGQAFRVLTFVAAPSANSVTGRVYSYRDTAPGKAGARYYRLRQVDLDGRASFSPTRVVRFDGDGFAFSCEAAPNPFGAEGLRLFVTLPQAEAATQLTVLDALGRRVLSQPLRLPAGSSQAEVSGAAALAAGVYVMEVSLNGQLLHRRVVKR